MARNHNTNDSHKYFDWLEFSSADLVAAQILMDTGHCNDLAAFHCQQCMEKSLKAFSLYENGRPLDGHNLTWLCKQAAKSDKRFNHWLDDSAKFNRYYIQTRYPSDQPLDITDHTVEQIYRVAREMYDFICLKVYGPGSVDDDD